MNQTAAVEDKLVRVVNWARSFDCPILRLGSQRMKRSRAIFLTQTMHRDLCMKRLVECFKRNIKAPVYDTTDVMGKRGSASVGIERVIMSNLLVLSMNMSC